jgi:transcription-repair coupling factor
LSGLLEKHRHLTVSGAGNETAKAMLVAHLRSFGASPSLLVAQDDTQVEALAHWLRFFEETVAVLPAEPDGEGGVLLTPGLLQGFLQFMEGDRSVFLASRGTYDAELPLYEELVERRLELAPGAEIDFTRFVEELLERGYEHGSDQYLAPGEYRRLGDTLDIFPIQCAHPYRVEFHFDTVEKISAVDAADLSKTEPHKGPLHLLPLSFARTAPLGQQLPEKSLLILDDQDDAEAPLHRRTLRFTSFPEGREQHAHLRYLSILKFYTLTDFLNDLKDKLHQKWNLVIVSRRSDELKAIFREESIPFETPESQRPGAVTVAPAGEEDLLPHSIQNPDLQSALLTDREIFSLKKQGRERSVQKLALDFITSLSAGDYVVHMEHGIGRFEGMTQKMIDGALREYLELSYAEGDKLFIPVDQADKLSKYVHEEGDEPVLTRLGTAEWKKVTEKLKAETKEVAKELLNLYAKRAAAKGFAFSRDQAAEEKFAAGFPYELTPGQRKAIDDIERDMEDGHPMDRLVCGDVGFGKTEVAIRAAFKAVRGGKQVAVIAPITILVDQHFRNFRERMKDFPIRIEMLSRFRTQKEQTAVLEKLRKGDVDIVVGTHRLLQDDVQFFNLGLLVIDEEQRFGVKQKEKFKEMRASVDILTMTATPIPRTLNLGLHKLRDITTITTPPPGRLPIITEVRKYSDALTREAIKKELARGGQAFVLHNRVETIDAFAKKIADLVPEAKVVVGHGQLKPEELEERILGFKEGRFTVLVSSTIIENGIDLPRANTLIVNEAEKFGLAQLYQLRGRVGRGKVQAYAYLLYHSQRLKDDAKKRLRAIVEACELGSGFQVAMRDLEIRGAGEILGVSQAGTMNSVGVSHYLRILKNAVAELKAGATEVREEVETEILLPVEALIPTFYVPDSGEKIAVYQKLASAEDEAILKEFHADLKDEYGDPPKQVEALFSVLRLKLACRRAGVTRVKSEELGKNKRELTLTLAPHLTAQEIMQLVMKHPEWKIRGNQLCIDEAKLKALSEKGDWLGLLAEHVKLLHKAPKKKAAKDEAVAEKA